MAGGEFRDKDAGSVNKKQIKKINELNGCFRRCFNGKDGKVVLAYLEDLYHINETTWRNEEKDMIFSEGQRTVVLDIKERMNRKPEEGEENG